MTSNLSPDSLLSPYNEPYPRPYNKPYCRPCNDNEPYPGQTILPSYISTLPTILEEVEQDTGKYPLPPLKETMVDQSKATLFVQQKLQSLPEG
ncbi:MAG: hypothetical protein JJU12_01785 [Chlamydiales bacterium]|nr:hypothetical protein [Chlamydiales bacterium]